MGGYALFVRPVVEPPGLAEERIPMDQSTGPLDRWWENFFADNSWQQQSPTLLMNRRGILLAKTFEQTSPKTLQLKPLTIIIPFLDEESEESERGKGQPVEGAWVVSASEGATINVAQNFNAQSDPLPTIESGTLSGPITITRRNISGVEEQPWLLTTRDLIIDRGRVSTGAEVKIEWPEGIIRGRELRIDLLGGLFSNNSDSDTGPLDRLEVYRIEEFKVDLPMGGIWSSLSSGIFRDRADVRTMPARMELFCSGRFAFDFRRSTASLSDGVQIHQIFGNASGPPLVRDEFASQEIKATFIDSDELPSGYDDLPEFGDMRLTKLQALGVDQLKDFYGEKKVEINAPSIGAFLSAKALKADLIEQRINLDGQLSLPGATQSMVRLGYQGHEFWSPSIEYDANGRDKTRKAEHLGVLVAEGPGEVNVLHTEKRLGTTHVRWTDALVMRPTDDRTQQQVLLAGQTLIRNSRHGILTSKKFDIRLRKTLITDEQGQPKESYRPEHIQALNEVVLNGDRFRANFDSAVIGLLYPEQEFSATDQPTESGGDSMQLSNSAGQGMYQWVGPPTAPPPQPAGEITVAQDRQELPVNLRATSVQATVILAGKDAWVDDLQMAGPLTLWQDSKQQQSVPEKEWQIWGDQLSLFTDRENNADVEISGAPARVSFGTGELTGPAIHVDQKRNLVWMDGAGRLQLPVEIAAPRSIGAMASTQGAASLGMHPSAASGLAKPDAGDLAKSIQWVDAPVVTWMGGLYFDGQNARIKDAVEIAAKMRGKEDTIWHVETESDHLNVLIAGPPLILGEDTSEDVTVDALDLTGAVKVHALEFDFNGKQRNYEHLAVPELSIWPEESKLVGQGPGSLHSWNLSTKKIKDPQGQERRTEQWMGSHLVFRDEMVGLMDRNEIVLEGKVELLTSPIASLDEEVDLYKIRRLKQGQGWLACDQLRLYETSDIARLVTGKQTTSDAWAYQARGNVTFEGIAESGQYDGNGYELVFDQAKNQVILRGDGRRDAVVRQFREGKGLGRATVREARFNPDTFEVNILPGFGGWAFDAAPGTPGSPTNGQSGLPPNPRDAVKKIYGGNR